MGIIFLVKIHKGLHLSTYSVPDPAVYVSPSATQRSQSPLPLPSRGPALHFSKLLKKFRELASAKKFSEISRTLRRN